MSVHIKDILNEFFKKGKEESKSQERIEGVLKNILGENFLDHITIKGIYKNKLVVNLSNSAVQYEVGLKKKELHLALKKEFPDLEEIQLKLK